MRIGSHRPKAVIKRLVKYSLRVSFSHVRTFPCIQLYLPSVRLSNFPFSICSLRNPDRQVLYSTTIRLGTKATLADYSFPATHINQP